MEHLSDMTGDRLREIRCSIGWERWQLARALDLSTDQIARMESGVAPIPLSIAGRLLVLCAAL